MELLIMPVANGVLPRSQGGNITGMFLFGQGGELLLKSGAKKDVLICPWIESSYQLYPVGVLARVRDAWLQNAIDESGGNVPVVMVHFEGGEYARWNSLLKIGNYLYSPDISLLDLKAMRNTYPVILGAGWMPEGGYTEFRSPYDLPVTIYGTDVETGDDVSITANLGGLVSMEHAHTIEHAIIRSLKIYGLCTVKTLIESMQQETTELKNSIEFSIKNVLPEALGITETGACGNNMTNLAQFYFAQDFISNLEEDTSLMSSIEKARKSTMSHVASDLGLTMQSGLRVLQGLKKGMSHDDTPLKTAVCKKVLKRFPIHPWA